MNEIPWDRKQGREVDARIHTLNLALKVVPKVRYVNEVLTFVSNALIALDWIIIEYTLAIPDEGVSAG